MELDGLLSTAMLSPAVTLTFDLLTRKPNQYVSRPRYIHDFGEISSNSDKNIVFTRFLVIACCNLDL